LETFLGEGESMKKQKSFQEFMTEMDLVKLHEDMVNALQSNDSKFVESVTIRMTKTVECLRVYANKGNSDAKGLVALLA